MKAADSIAFALRTIMAKFNCCVYTCISKAPH